MQHINGQYYGVEMPEGATEPKINTIVTSRPLLEWLMFNPELGYFTHDLELPSGEWEIVGMVRDFKVIDWVNNFQCYSYEEIEDYKKQHNLTERKLIIKKLN